MLQADVRIIRADSSYDVNYTYLVPDELRGEIREGVFVSVPFGAAGRGRYETGIVVSLSEGGSTKSFGGRDLELKPVKEVNRLYQPLDREQMLLAEEIARRCVTSAASAYRLISVRAGRLAEKVSIVAPAAGREACDAYLKAKKHKKIQTFDAMELLFAKGPMEENELVKYTGVSKQMLAVLAKDGIITREKTVRVAEPDDGAARAGTEAGTEDGTAAGTETRTEAGTETGTAGGIETAPSGIPDTRDTPKELNEEQAAALAALKERLDRREFSEFLLRGVTGSGKTEVYFHLIDHALSKGLSAIILVPEIVLTEQMIKRITSRFGGGVAVIHGGISPDRKAREYEKMRRGITRIVLGARSAVFAPLKDLGLIIIDEEQEPSYKADPVYGGAGSFAPENDIYYSAPEVAAMRMKNLGGLVVYGSATPKVTTFYRAEKGETGYALLSKRALADAMPKVEIVDMRKEIAAGNRTPLSSRLAAEIHRNIEKGEKTIIFVPRRGFSARLTCEVCGKVVGCRRCMIAMSYHKKANRIVCHHCGATETAPSVCPGCGSDALSSKVYGSEMVEETVRKLFPEVNIVRMDSDTAKLPGSHEALLRQFAEPGPSILIGTQMVTKGLDFPDVTLVGVTGGDSLAAVGEYNSGERAFVLLTQVFGRAGRTAEKPGRCILQTMDPESRIITRAANQDYDAFYRDTIKYRRDLGFPPFAFVASVTVSGADDRGAFRLCSYLHDSLVTMAEGSADDTAVDRSEGSADDPAVNSSGSSAENSAGQSGRADPPVILKTARAAIPKVDDNYFWRFNVKCSGEEAATELLQSFRSAVILPLLRGENKALYGFRNGKPLYKITINRI